jgi:hypothetical protein
MKLTKIVVKQFEQDQEAYGTKTALFNIIWLIAGQLMKDIGVKGIKTKVGHEKK